MSETPSPDVGGQLPEAWSPGVQVGRYVLLARIAVGGMAEIWLARQPGLKGFERLVVIKRMIDSLSADPVFVEQFLDEARIAVQLNHPNIVQVYDLGEHTGAWYIAMEYIEGEHLGFVMRTSLKAGVEVPLPVCVKVVSMVAEGLAFAHGKRDLNGQPLGIIHRDVSPQNVMITYDGQIKLLDFGIARATSRSSQTTGGEIKGKFSYMSPEQVQSRPLDPRSDLFALGVVLYEIVTRSRLFVLKDVFEAMKVIPDPTPVEPAMERNPAVSPVLSAIIDRAIAKAPQDRYPDLQSFHLALESWLKEQTENPGPSEIAAFMKSLFAERIEARTRLVQRAKHGELSAAKVAEGLRVEGLASSLSGQSHESSLSVPGHKRRQVSPRSWLIAGGALALLLTALAVWRLEQAPAGPGEPVTVGPPTVVVTPPVVKPPVVAPAPAMLLVDTEPRGALIELDGREVGPAPATIVPIEVGEHAVVATLPGYQVARRVVTIGSASERAQVVLVLLSMDDKPPPLPRPVVAKGKLSLNTVPWTTVAIVGGRKLGDTPLVDLPLAAGRYTLTLVNAQKNITQTIEVEIKAGQTTNKMLKL